MPAYRDMDIANRFLVPLPGFTEETWYSQPDSVQAAIDGRPEIQWLKEQGIAHKAYSADWDVDGSVAVVMFQDSASAERFAAEWEASKN